MSESALTPLRFALLDGEEREFLLTFRAMRRSRNAIAALPAADQLGIVSLTLYEALCDKSLNMEEFEDLLPLDFGRLKDFVRALMEHSGFRPTEAEAETQTPRKMPKKV